MLQKNTFFMLGDWERNGCFLTSSEKYGAVTSYETLKKSARADLKENNNPGLSKTVSIRPTLWAGFLSYELGYKFLGINPREKPGFPLPEVLFTPCHISEIPFNLPAPGNRKILSPNSNGFSHISSNLSRESYLSKIEIIKEKLRDGETYQVNFSQQFSVEVPASFSAFDYFITLAALNPSPYQFFYENDDFAVISNSPELLVRGYWEHSGNNVRQKFIVETQPIKGTVPRGKTEAEDKIQIQKLLNSKKEEAELVMIVDLERNDLGKVCKPGTVEVKEHRRIEKYSHVIHTASVVRGELQDGKDVFDVLEAIFPGGSVTGCPKKRTMEIIDELEDVKRGVYCGSAGYIAQDGSFEFNIMIRTAFFDKHAQRPLLIFSSGGGIVIDSDPEKEYEETLHKAHTFFDALAVRVLTESKQVITF